MILRILLTAATCAGALVVALPLAAQEDDATAAAEKDAKEAIQMATPSPSQMNAGSMDSGSSSSGSSHTESSSSSTSFSLSVGAPTPTLGAPPRWRPGPNPNSGATLNGGWKLSTADGSRSCTLKLSDGDDSDKPHYAWTATGGPDGSLLISRWRYDGRWLLLTTIAGDTVADLHRVGRNRFEGSNIKSGEALVVSR